MKSHATIPPSYSPQPVTIYLRPGQQVTIVGTDDNGNVPGGGAGGVRFRTDATQGSRSSDGGPSRSSDGGPSRSSDRRVK